MRKLILYILSKKELIDGIEYYSPPKKGLGKLLYNIVYSNEVLDYKQVLREYLKQAILVFKKENKFFVIDLNRTKVVDVQIVNTSMIEELKIDEFGFTVVIVIDIINEKEVFKRLQNTILFNKLIEGKSIDNFKKYYFDCEENSDKVISFISFYFENILKYDSEDSIYVSLSSSLGLLA